MHLLLLGLDLCVFPTHLQFSILTCRNFCNNSITPIIIIIIIKKDWQCKAGRERLTPYQSEDPNPTKPTHRRKEEIGKSVGDKKWNEQLGQQKGIGPALKTRQSHTIEHRVSKIIPERYREGNKTPAILQGSAARRRVSIPMCDQSTSCDPRWHKRHRQSTTEWVHWVTSNLV